MNAQGSHLVSNLARHLKEEGVVAYSPLYYRLRKCERTVKQMPKPSGPVLSDKKRNTRLALKQACKVNLFCRSSGCENQTAQLSGRYFPGQIAYEIAVGVRRSTRQKKLSDFFLVA